MELYDTSIDRDRNAQSAMVQETLGSSRPPPPVYIVTNIPASNSYNNIRVTSPLRGDPPTYEEALFGNASPPPPSYDSVFGKVEEARRQSSNIVQFFKNIFILLLGTISCTVIVGVIIVIPICMILFGTIYMHECPVSKYIPVYLLIGGVMGIIKPLLTLSLRVRTSQEDQAVERMRQVGTQSMLSWFIFAWFVIGSYWVYREYEPNYDPSKGKYCNKTLYKFAFWLVTSAYISCAVVVVILIVLTIISVLLHIKVVNVNVSDV